MNNQGNKFDELLKYGIDNKPKELIISDLKWKYLVRCVLRGENILLVGSTGCGKTMAARLVAKILSRPFFKFNMGSSDDARATLIGNTTYRKEIGTVFHPSPFVKAITTSNAVVLLDELTRGSHAAWNIAIPILDFTQRDLRLDEDSESDVIHVADGVCFVATANVGSEYTSTRVLDKAIAGRFPIKIEMEPLDSDQLKELFRIMFPSSTPKCVTIMDTLASISDDIRLECKKEDTNISTILPPRSMVKMAELVLDGFTLAEIAEMIIYPEYPDDGGADSERTFCKAVLQKYFSVDVDNPIQNPRKRK